MKKILTLILTIFLFASSVYAAECELTDANGFCLITDPATYVEIFGTTYFGKELDESVHPGGTFFKVSDKDEIIYCSDGVMPTDELSNDVEAYDKNCTVLNLNKKSLIYSYEYGYGEYKDDGEYNSSDYLTGNRIEDYYITQTAVWNFSPPDDYLEYWTWFSGYDFTNKTFNGIANNRTVIKISNLINDATAAASAVPSLSVGASNLTMNLTDDGKYYISDAIKLTGSYLNEAVSVSVTGVNNAFVTKDKNATSGSSSFFDGTRASVSETVYVKVPVNNVTGSDTNIKLHVQSQSAFNDDTKIIECHITKETVYQQQPMIKYVPNYIVLEDDVTFNIKKYSVTISKKDVAGKQLTGATLVIKQNDKVITTWTTSGSKNIMLSPGTYTLEESKAPNGYVAMDNKITFIVDESGIVYVNDNVTKEIVVTNKPILVTVSKKELNKDEELVGATLVVTDNEGNIAKDLDGNELRWVSEEEAKVFHMVPGTYILSEEKAPEGYELSDEQMEFTVNTDGSVTIKQGLLVKTDKVLKNNVIVFENTLVPEPVDTGSMMLYAAIIVGLLSFGITTFMVIRREQE